MRQRPLDSQILRRFNIRRMSEYFRRVIIKFFLKKNLISATLATTSTSKGFPLQSLPHHREAGPH